MENSRLRQAVLEVVENQLRDNNPPETRQALDRLLAAGYPRKKALLKIAEAVTFEIWSVLHEGASFNRERYVDALSKLE